MKRNDIMKQLDVLEKDTELYIKEKKANKKLTKSRYELVDDITFILANLQLISPNMQIDKKSFEYLRLVEISDKIIRAR
jgi:hypothetical protein